MYGVCSDVSTGWYIRGSHYRRIFFLKKKIVLLRENEMDKKHRWDRKTDEQTRKTNPRRERKKLQKNADANDRHAPANTLDHRRRAVR